MRSDREVASGTSNSPPIERLLTPFREFAQSNASSGVLLFGAAVIALVWANSAFSRVYFELWQTPVTVQFGSSSFSFSLQHLINDGLMAVFFLLVGLEIKREILIGELASRRRATLPIAAAVGGAILPAIIYIAFVGLGPQERGWGIPMATDIAFALGVLAVLGSRVPIGLKVFVTAFAIVDDLIAVLVIALFYTSDLNMGALLVAAAIVGALVVANLLGIRRPVVYGALGVMLWFAVYQSGVHATVAGVALAAVIPARVRLDAPGFVRRARSLLDSFDRRIIDSDYTADEHHHAALWELEATTEQAQSPMLRIEHSLQPWVAFLIVPLFALANAGVALVGDPLATLSDPVVLGIVVGLIVGKQIGITSAAWLVVRFGLARLPEGVSWWHIYGAAWLGGIGFTMSLFIAELAFRGTQELQLAKLGILVASVIAGTGGFLVLRAVIKRESQSGDG